MAGDGLVQPLLFEVDPELAEAFATVTTSSTKRRSGRIVAEIERLPFRAFQFHGFEGRRRVVSFGWRYDFNEAKLIEATPVPRFLQPVREKAARFAGLDADALEQLLVTEYESGATIGWHKDRPVFGEVIGVSLLAPCAFRFRQRDGSGWLRAAISLAPRSAYILSGAARSQWEHSIPAVERLRYSLTFRTFRLAPQRS